MWALLQREAGVEWSCAWGYASDPEVGAVAGGLPEGCGAGTAGGCGEDSPCSPGPPLCSSGTPGSGPEAPPGVRAPRLRSPVPVVSSDPLIRLGVFKMEVSAHS